MDKLLVFRAAHLFPHLELLRKIGSPLETELSRAKLPLNIGQEPDALLPLRRALDFLTSVIYREGIEDFELRAVHGLKVEQLGPQLVSEIRLSPTLNVALEKFCKFVVYESNYTHFWIESNSTHARLFTYFSASRNPRSIRHSEWNQIIAPIYVIREYAGPGWCPPEIGLQSNIPVGEFAKKLFPNTRIVVGQKNGYIKFPRSLLSLALPKKLVTADINQVFDEPDTSMLESFPTTLKTVLRSYISEGYPDINLAASITGTSVRTLQRRLKMYGFSYKELVDQSRFDSATELLKNPDISNIEIAYAVGYEDPSNFARAFRRIAGTSPQEYRSQLLSA